MSMSSNTPKIQSTNPLGADGIVRCQHGEPVIRLTSHTLTNPNRDFYRCDRPPAERCGFWYWTDDLIFQLKERENKPSGTVTPPGRRSDSTITKMGSRQPGTAPPRDSQSSVPLSHASHVGPGGPSTPLPTPQRYTQPLAHPPETPVKRKRPNEADARAVRTTPSLSSLDTPSKRARLADIEAGLRARQEEQARQSLQQPHPQQQQQAPEPQQQEQEQEQETQPETPQPSPRPKARWSFLGLSPTQESMPSRSPPSTPRRASPALNANQQAAALLTPPQTSQRHTGRAFDANNPRPEPVTPTRRKGKERAHPQFDRFVQEDNPFVQGSSSGLGTVSDADALPIFSSTQQSSLEPLTTAEQINANMLGLRETIQTLTTHMDNLQQIDAVHNIELLERQKRAFELGDGAKKQRIAKLAAENEALKERVRTLEDDNRRKDKIIESLVSR